MYEGELENGPEALGVNAALLKEEAAARDAREKAAKSSVKPAQALTAEKMQKLDKLVDQATMYSQFLGEQVTSVQDRWQVVRSSFMTFAQRLAGIVAHMFLSFVYRLRPRVQPDDENADVGGKRKRNASSASAKKAKAAVKSPTHALVPSIQGELRNYQLRGVAWLISLWTNGMNGILADQMGLGKTVQTVAFLSHLRDNGIQGPFLIIVPLSTIINWQNEVSRWCPSMSAIVYHGTKADRQAMEKKWFRSEYSSMRSFDMLES